MRIAAGATRYLAVIDQVLAMDYLKPDLRRRVVRMQRQLILVETNTDFLSEDPVAPFA